MLIAVYNIRVYVFIKTVLCRPGHTFKLSYDIKKDTVSGYPDARFIAHESQKTIAVIEVF